MSHACSPDSSNNETENKYSSLNIKTYEDFKIEQFQPLVVTKTSELK